jgi:hypothetical protein
VEVQLLVGHMAAGLAVDMDKVGQELAVAWDTETRFQ